MLAYFDTGILLPLYVRELFTPAIKFFMNGRNECIALHLFHLLELENALRLKVFRCEMDNAHYHAVLDKIRADLDEGRIVRCPVDWICAFEEARRIGARVTARAGCRTLDLLHVAIAVQWKSEVFVTADDRQLQAARAAGLRTVDVRALPQDGFPSGAGREGRVRYRPAERSRIKVGEARPTKKARI
jgi:predicted nucleic acid-binding protein